jgi:hypothetical protein
MHWLALRQINALDSLFRCVLGIPIHSSRGRAVVVIAVLFFWGCIAGVMGAPSMLIWIGGIGVMAG